MRSASERAGKNEGRLGKDAGDSHRSNSDAFYLVSTGIVKTAFLCNVLINLGKVETSSYFQILLEACRRDLLIETRFEDHLFTLRVKYRQVRNP